MLARTWQIRVTGFVKLRLQLQRALSPFQSFHVSIGLCNGTTSRNMSLAANVFSTHIYDAAGVRWRHRMRVYSSRIHYDFGQQQLLGNARLAEHEDVKSRCCWAAYKGRLDLSCYNATDTLHTNIALLPAVNNFLSNPLFAARAASHSLLVILSPLNVSVFPFL